MILQCDSKLIVNCSIDLIANETDETYKDPEDHTYLLIGSVVVLIGVLVIIAAIVWMLFSKSSLTITGFTQMFKMFCFFRKK